MQLVGAYTLYTAVHVRLGFVCTIYRATLVDYRTTLKFRNDIFCATFETPVNLRGTPCTFSAKLVMTTRKHTHTRDRDREVTIFIAVSSSSRPIAFVLSGDKNTLTEIALAFNY